MKIRWTLHDVKVIEFFKGLWDDMMKDDVFGYAAQLSYYFFFSLFPLLICLTTLLGFLSDTGSSLRSYLLQSLAHVMPESAIELVVKTLEEISESASGSKFSLGLLVVLWTASSGMGAIISALNVAYKTYDSRPWWKVRLISIALTIAFGLLLIISSALVFYGGAIAEKLAARFGLSGVFTIAWYLFQWPLIFIFVLLSFGSIYYFGPNISGRKWQLFTPGAIAALILWVIVTLGFRFYLQHFNAYGNTYGSLGAVVILLLWFYLTGLAILIGGEINSELEKIQMISKEETE